MGTASRKEDGQRKDQLTTRMSSFRWCRHLVRIHLFWMIFYNIWCLFAEERVLPGAVLLLTLIYCSVIGCFCWSWYWDGFANLEILRNSASSFHWLSSELYLQCSFVRCSSRIRDTSSHLHCVSDHTNQIFSVRIWSVSFIAEWSPVYCCLVLL